MNVAWSPDGNYLAVGSNAGAPPKDDSTKDYVSIIDMRKSKVRKHKFDFEVNEFCFSPNSRYMLLTTEHGHVEVYNFFRDEKTRDPVSDSTGENKAPAVHPRG